MLAQPSSLDTLDDLLFVGCIPGIERSFLEIFQVLLLIGIPGIIFGWLYWSRGLWTAITAHFIADLMIHVIPSLK